MKTKNFLPMGVALANVLVAKLAMAAEGAGPGEGMGVWTLLFLGFGAAILLFQVVPAVMLLTTLVRELFRKPEIETARETERVR